jgi:hypothetical protein
VLDGGRIILKDSSGNVGVPVERLRALITLLYPEEMTPTAKRMIERVIEECELAH